MRLLNSIARSSSRLKPVLAGLLLAGTLTPAAHAGIFDWLLKPAADTSAQTRYPIVLVHGLFGFDNILGIDYWHGIPAHMTERGAKVHVARVSPVASNEVRGEQLLQQVRAIMAQTGATKVNLIGHSQGVPTARYVAGVRPDLIASVTSIAGPNKGSKVADLVEGLVQPDPGPVANAADAITTALGDLLLALAGGLPGAHNSGRGALYSVTSTGMATFNAKFPAGVPADCSNANGAELVNGVRYYSWAGTNAQPVQFGWLGPLTGANLDPSNYAMAAMGVFHGGAVNDGLVSVCSSRLGKHLGDYNHNHLDEVNQILGLVPTFSPDPRTLYTDHAKRLKGVGL